MTTRLSAVILAGGQSRRMGQDKALLEIAGTTLLARTVKTVQQLTDDVLVVGRTELTADCPSVRTVTDALPGMGPLAGLCTGLEHVSGTLAVCVGCDYPSLRAEALAGLARLVTGWEAAVPVVAGRGQFTHALYQRSILPLLQAEVDAGELSIRAAMRTVRVRWVAEDEMRALDPSLGSLRSVNTPAEWHEAQEMSRMAGYSSP